LSIYLYDAYILEAARSSGFRLLALDDRFRGTRREMPMLVPVLSPSES
jgi:hypothetical protein